MCEEMCEEMCEVIIQSVLSLSTFGQMKVISYLQLTGLQWEFGSLRLAEKQPIAQRSN